MKRAALLLLGLGLAVPKLLSAGLDTAWVRRYDGPAHGDDWATRLAVDSAGNVYVTGASMSDTGSNTQHLDFVTIKYLPNGDTAWVRRADFGGKDLPSGLGVDAQGNVYVTGTNNDSRMVTVKYGPTGNRLWYEFFGSQGGASDLVLDSQGNIVVCGSTFHSSSDAATLKYRPTGDTAWVRFYDWAGYEDCAQAVALGQNEALAMAGFGAGATSHYDCISVMYDSSGGKLWAAGYDGPNHGDDRAFDMSVSSSGNLVTTGHTDDGYGTPPDYLTMMYSPQGETIWTRRYDGPAHDWDEASAMALGHDGSVLVTGYSHGQSTNDDYTTIKYDSAGTQIWVARYDGPGHGGDDAHAIAVDAQGNSYVTGGVWVSQNVGGDCSTIKYSPIGESLWCALYNGPGNWSDQGSVLAIDGEGGVYVAGVSSNGFLRDGDIVTIKYVQNGGVAEVSHAPVAFRLSLVAEPSVFSQSTAVRFCAGKTARAGVTVFDAGGRRVGVIADGVHEGSINWDGTDGRGVRLPPGVYVVVLEAGAERIRVKVVMSE